MTIPSRGFLIVIVRFGEYKETLAKDTRRVLMGIRVGGLPEHVRRKLEDAEFVPVLYALVRSSTKNVRRATGGLAIYRYRINIENAEALIECVKEYLKERCIKANYLGWREFNILVARWVV